MKKLLIILIFTFSIVFAQTLDLAKLEDSSKIFVGALNGAMGDTPDAIAYLPAYGLNISYRGFEDKSKELLPKARQVVQLVGITVSGLPNGEWVSISYTTTDNFKQGFVLRFKVGQINTTELFINGIKQP